MGGGVVYNIQNHWVSGLCPILVGPLESANELIEVSSFQGTQHGMCLALPSPENRIRFHCQNVVSCSYLEFRTIDKVQKRSNSIFKSFQIYSL
jgi:hypothetical protein